jgi:hypothetical protein
MTASTAKFPKTGWALQAAYKEAIEIIMPPGTEFVTWRPSALVLRRKEPAGHGPGEDF